ncbi:unnamed protein product [Acanthoscelides obtectus]|uniref:Uncharacterized protein n=1 Tax=Acanthoscelides obtectus TaxID=200917 RepID=A0A9P0P4Q2_ACAOB|nr:unnamed protein product [Acanthoscelides obtectus]CAK1639417.1 hypothetical protein AOBTE_LOCUS11173 [Acanthoscelides obtectus]
MYSCVILFKYVIYSIIVVKKNSTLRTPRYPALVVPVKGPRSKH